jgi:hypothetical protein
LKKNVANVQKVVPKCPIERWITLDSLLIDTKFVFGPKKRIYLRVRWSRKVIYGIYMILYKKEVRSRQKSWGINGYRGGYPNRGCDVAVHN